MEKGSNTYVVTIDRDELVPKLIERATGLSSVSFRSIGDLQSRWDQLAPATIFLDSQIDSTDRTLSLIPEFRKRWPFCPVHVLSRDGVDNVVGDALALGADDVMLKPLRAKEISARFQARLSDQAAKEAKQSLRFGNMVFDNQHRLLTGTRGSRYLSSTESNLLLCLVQAKGAIVERETLKRRCWGVLQVSDGALDRKIYEVRRAFEEIGGNGAIRTAYGIGFGLELNEAM